MSPPAGNGQPPATSAQSEPALQRHASWEHRLLGDVDPRTLQVITSANEFAGRPYYVRELVLAQDGQVLREEQNQAVHALTEQLDFLRSWQGSSPPPGTSEWRGVRLVTIRLDDGDEVVCTRGEMNGLADFYGSLDQLRRGKKSTLERILQTVRQESWQRISQVLRRLDPDIAAKMDSPEFGGASHFTEGKPAELEMQAITADQRNRRSETYLANVARNACHFAPQSWFTWREYHEQARELADQAWHARQTAERENNESLREVAERIANEAVVTNGFGDHYLQDSFAAGHLVNKTLIMQWFVEWLGSQNLAERLIGTSAGLRWIRNWAQVRTLTHELQPELAGLELYEKPEHGQASDPQAAENQATRAERIARTRIRDTGRGLDRAYANYLAFLNSAAVQAAAGELHDFYCREGLEVYANGTSIGYVFGDNNMVSGGTGVEFSAETAQLSQQAIDDMIAGREPCRVSDILARLPDHVKVGGRPMSLAEWHSGGMLREFCEQHIFPRVPYRLAGQLPLAPFGVSQDVWGGRGPARMGRVRDLLLGIGRLASRVRDAAAEVRDSLASSARHIRRGITAGARWLAERVTSGARHVRRGITSGARRVIRGAESAHGQTQERLDIAVEALWETVAEARETVSQRLPDVPEVTQEALEGVLGSRETEPAASGGDRHDGPF